MQILCDYVLLFALSSDLNYGAGNVEFVLAFLPIRLICMYVLNVSQLLTFAAGIAATLNDGPSLPALLC